MIITCDKCSTKFNLDETRIQQTGSKVRCSVCRHVFSAYPPESPERDEREKAQEKPGDLEESPPYEEKETGETSEDKSFLGLEGIDELGHELDIEDDEREKQAEPAADRTGDSETAQEDDQTSTETPFPAYELEIDKELEEEISSLEMEAQDIEPAAPEVPFETEPELETVFPESGQEEKIADSEPDSDKDFLEEDLREEEPELDIDIDEEFSFEEEDESTAAELQGMDFEESTDVDTLEAVPDQPEPSTETPDAVEETESFSLDTDDSVERAYEFDTGVAETPEKPEDRDTEFDFEEEFLKEERSDSDLGGEEEFSLDGEEEFNLDTEDEDTLDLDLEELDIEEDSKDSEHEFDLDLDDETVELGMEDLEADEETEFHAGQEENTEFDFMTAGDESFELEIDSDLNGEAAEEADDAEEEEFQKESAEVAEPDEQQELEPPELEIGELDLSDTDEMDIELDDDIGREHADEFEFELEDEEEEPGGGIELEEEFQSEPVKEEEEEFDLTLYDESLEDEFEEAAGEAHTSAQPEEEKRLEAETETRTGIEEKKTEKPPVPGFMDQETVRKRPGSSKFLKFILALLVSALLLAAGYSTCFLMGIRVPYISSIKIPYIESALQKYQSRPEPVNIVLDNQSINGRFASNKAEGKLFIITGRAANKSAFPVSHLQVEGTLITKGDVTARTKQVYCGNMIPEDTLKTAAISSIDQLLTRKRGMDGSNENIRPNGSIPFMIVFSNLPENLENFSVKLAGHSRPDQGN